MTERLDDARPWVGRLIRFVRHPSTNLVVGIVLIVSGSAEAIEDLRGTEGVELAVHHGVIVYGLFKVLTAAADIFEGLEKSLKRYEAAGRGATRQK